MGENNECKCELLQCSPAASPIGASRVLHEEGSGKNINADCQTDWRRYKLANFLTVSLSISVNGLAEESMIMLACKSGGDDIGGTGQSGKKAHIYPGNAAGGIDNHHKDYVSAYLGDLGRDLPEAEQNHWLQYNVVTSEKLSSVAFQRDFLCMFYESNMSDLKFKAGFKRFQKKWRQSFSWDLFLPLSESDEYNIKLLRIPITESQEEFDHQVLSLVKTIIDSLNEKEIVKQLKNSGDLKGGIS